MEAYDDELLFFLPYFPTHPSLSNDLLFSFFWSEKLWIYLYMYSSLWFPYPLILYTEEDTSFKEGKS